MARPQASDSNNSIRVLTRPAYGLRGALSGS
jgi:hypothetical protein